MDLIEHEASVVVVGDLNPAIFHPEWLARLELISPRDLEGADIQVVHKEISLFELPWVRFDVRDNRFVLRCNDPAYFGPLRDLAIGIFSYLEHTPVSAIGINGIFKYRVVNEENWHCVGDTLVPKQLWEQHLNTRAGMTQVSVTSDRTDELEGRVNITVAPLPDQNRNGILININNHIVVKGAEDIKTALTKHWDRLIKQTEELSSGILLSAGAK